MASSHVLEIALAETERPSLRPLPERAAELLADLDAPPRLVAHLRAVHDVAAQLLDWLEGRNLGLGLDSRSVLFGAATHDIGKVLHPAELSGPGAEHEHAGKRLLIAHGVDAGMARFAATHASWTPDTGIEELLVSLADKIWKNKRVPELEDLVVARVAAASGQPAWEEFLSLDEFLTRIGDGADERLAFQLSFPVAATSPRPSSVPVEMWSELLVNPERLAALYTRPPALKRLVLRSVQLSPYGPALALRVEFPSFPDRAPATWTEAGCDRFEGQIYFLAVGDELRMRGLPRSTVVDVQIAPLVHDTPERRIQIAVRGEDFTLEFTSAAALTASHFNAYRSGNVDPYAARRWFASRVDQKLYELLPPTTRRPFYDHP